MKAQKPTGCDNAHLMDLLLADSEFIAEELGKVDQPLHWLDVAAVSYTHLHPFCAPSAAERKDHSA